MLRIDNSLLQEVGLDSLPDAEKNSLLKHIYETLEMRVGIRLADQMSNEQLDEFERYFEAKDDAGAFKWLETNFPNYKEIVQEEFDKLKGEVTQSAPQILAGSQAQAASGTQPSVPPVNPGQPTSTAPAVPPSSVPPAPTQTPPAVDQAAYYSQQPAAPAPNNPAPGLNQTQTPPAYQPDPSSYQQQPLPRPDPTSPPYQPPGQTPPAPSTGAQPPFPSQQPPAGPASN